MEDDGSCYAREGGMYSQSSLAKMYKEKWRLETEVEMK